MELQASRPLYYFLVTIITQFILALVALVVLVSTGLLYLLPLKMLGLLMAYNVFMAAGVAAIISGQAGQNEKSIQQGAGLVIGHLVGLVLGGIVGAHYGGPVWGIWSAVVCYFIVGWFGSRISLAVGVELERRARATYEPESRIQVRGSRTNQSSLFFFGAVVPLMFMTGALLVKNSGLPVAQYSQGLPAARIVLVVLSLFSIAIPRLRQIHWAERKNTLSHGRMTPIIGMGFSLAPAAYGFLLFAAFGMSLAELSLFSVAASIAATTWGMSAASRKY